MSGKGREEWLSIIPICSILSNCIAFPVPFLLLLNNNHSFLEQTRHRSLLFGWIISTKHCATFSFGQSTQPNVPWIFCVWTFSNAAGNSTFSTFGSSMTTQIWNNTSQRHTTHIMEAGPHRRNRAQLWKICQWFCNSISTLKKQGTSIIVFSFEGVLSEMNGFQIGKIYWETNEAMYSLSLFQKSSRTSSCPIRSISDWEDLCKY